MNPPRVTVLVHGGPNSIEMVRVRGLTRRHPADRLRILHREGGMSATWRAWSWVSRENRGTLRMRSRFDNIDMTSPFTKLLVGESAGVCLKAGIFIGGFGYQNCQFIHFYP